MCDLPHIQAHTKSSYVNSKPIAIFRASINQRKRPFDSSKSLLSALRLNAMFSLQMQKKFDWWATDSHLCYLPLMSLDITFDRIVQLL